MAKTIILEGVDCSGKSTLAHHLEDYGYVYQHHGLYDDAPQELFRRYVMSIWKAVKNPNAQVIDRCFLSESVYGEIVRGKCRLGEVGVRLLTRLQRSLGVGEVICLPSWETVKNGWLEKKGGPVGDYLDKLDVVRKVYFRYRELLISRKFTYVYDWNTLDRGEFQRTVILAHQGDSLPRGVLGSPSARVLFVGEQVNLNKTRTDLPFFSLTGSSAFLCQAMIAAQVDESQIAIVNACGPYHTIKNLDSRSHKSANKYKDLVRIKESIGFLGGDMILPTIKKVVALGKVADHALTSQGIEHVTLPHPSYVKRFKNGHLDKYVDDIREVMRP